MSVSRRGIPFLFMLGPVLYLLLNRSTGVCGGEQPENWALLSLEQASSSGLTHFWHTSSKHTGLGSEILRHTCSNGAQTPFRTIVTGFPEGSRFEETWEEARINARWVHERKEKTHNTSALGRGGSGQYCILKTLSGRYHFICRMHNSSPGNTITKSTFSPRRIRYVHFASSNHNIALLITIYYHQPSPYRSISAAFSTRPRIPHNSHDQLSPTSTPDRARRAIPRVFFIFFTFLSQHSPIIHHGSPSTIPSCPVRLTVFCSSPSWLIVCRWRWSNSSSLSCFSLPRRCSRERVPRTLPRLSSVGLSNLPRHISISISLCPSIYARDARDRSHEGFFDQGC